MKGTMSTKNAWLGWCYFVNLKNEKVDLYLKLRLNLLLMTMNLMAMTMKRKPKTNSDVTQTSPFWLRNAKLRLMKSWIEEGIWIDYDYLCDGIWIHVAVLTILICH